MIKIELKADKVTVDMIELAINIEPKEFQKNIARILHTFELNPELEYYDNLHWKSYRHNWIWKTEDYTIFLVYRCNSGNGEATNKFKIKYNPNKVDPNDRFLRTMLPIFKYTKHFPEITWFDIAFDYDGVTTSDIIFDKGKKREWKVFSYPNSDLTYYLGKSGKNGGMKIYDKANEEKQGQADYNKTRVEVTIRDKVSINDINAWKCKIDIPKLYLRQILGLYDDKKLSPTEKLLVYSVENSYPVDKLTYRQRCRYEEIVSSRDEIYTEIKPSQLDIEKAIQNFVNNLLN